MGGCFSFSGRFEDFRKSLIGKYLKDEDQPTMFKICETTRSREVDVVIQTSSHDRMTLATFSAGESIVLLPDATYKDGAMKCGNFHLFYVLRGGTDGGDVVSVERRRLAEFLKPRPHLERLALLTNICSPLLCAFLQLPSFESISLDQMRILYSAMHLTRFSPGQVITLHGDDAPQPTDPHPAENDNNAHTNNNIDSQFRPLERAITAAKRRLLNKLTQPMIPYGTVGILLHGTCAFFPDVHELMDMLTDAMVDALRSYSRDDLSNADLGCEFIELQGALMAHRVFPGSVFGYENFFIEQNHVQPDSMVALDPGAVGRVSALSLQTLFQVDPSLKRVLRRNFNLRVVDSIREKMPLLSDLEETLYRKLCAKVVIKCVAKDEVVVTRGQDSSFAYIIAQGLVQETDFTQGWVHREAQPSKLTVDTAATRYLGTGSLFGEVALVTDSAYFSTVKAIEPTVLIGISRRALDLVYNQDKAKLAGLQIRLTGPAAELDAVLGFPASNQLFAKFCDKEMSGENAAFYTSAAGFEEMFERLQHFVMRSVHMSLWAQIAEQNTELDEKGAESGCWSAGEPASGSNSVVSASRKAAGKKLSISRPTTSQDAAEGLDTSSGRAGQGLVVSVDPKDEASFRRGVRSNAVAAAISSGDSPSTRLRRRSISRNGSESIFQQNLRQAAQGRATAAPSSPAMALAASLTAALGAARERAGGGEERGLDEEDAPPTPSAPVLALSAAELPEIQKILEKQLRDLREVAQQITERHVLPGACSEVNLPAAVRRAVLDAQASFQAQSVPRSIAQVLTAMVAKHAPRADAAAELAPYQVLGPAIFRDAKAEVFALMKRDAFVRFKASAEFSQFLERMRPYQQDTLVRTVDMASYSRRSGTPVQRGHSLRRHTGSQRVGSQRVTSYRVGAQRVGSQRVGSLRVGSLPASDSPEIAAAERELATLMSQVGNTQMHLCVTTEDPHAASIMETLRVHSSPKAREADGTAPPGAEELAVRGDGGALEPTVCIREREGRELSGDAVSLRARSRAEAAGPAARSARAAVVPTA